MNTLYCKQLRLLYSTYIIHKIIKQLIGFNIYEMDVGQDLLYIFSELVLFHNCHKPNVGIFLNLLFNFMVSLSCVPITFTFRCAWEEKQRDLWMLSRALCWHHLHNPHQVSENFNSLHLHNNIIFINTISSCMGIWKEASMTGSILTNFPSSGFTQCIICTGNSSQI